MCPSRQNSPDQYSARAVAVVWAALAANGQQLAGEPHPHQHRHHRFEHVGEDHHEGEGPPKVR